MKILIISQIAFCICCSMTMAESPFVSELDKLTKQRDKAIAEATGPIHKRFEELTAQLLKRATQAGDLDAALKIKSALPLASEQKNEAPEVQTLEMQLLGSWDCKSTSGWTGVYTFKENGAMDGTHKWRKVGNSLRVVKENGAFDEYELPIRDERLVGKSAANNTLILTKAKTK